MLARKTNTHGGKQRRGSFGPKASAKQALIGSSRRSSLPSSIGGRDLGMSRPRSSMGAGATRKGVAPRSDAPTAAEASSARAGRPAAAGGEGGSTRTAPRAVKRKPSEAFRVSARSDDDNGPLPKAVVSAERKKRLRKDKRDGRRMREGALNLALASSIEEALTYFNMNMHDKAREVFARIASSPELPEAKTKAVFWIARARVEEDAGRYSETLALFKEGFESVRSEFDRDTLEKGLRNFTQRMTAMGINPATSELLASPGAAGKEESPIAKRLSFSSNSGKPSPSEGAGGDDGAATEAAAEATDNASPQEDAVDETVEESVEPAVPTAEVESGDPAEDANVGAGEASGKAAAAEEAVAAADVDVEVAEADAPTQRVGTSADDVDMCEEGGATPDAAADQATSDSDDEEACSPAPVEMKTVVLQEPTPSTPGSPAPVEMKTVVLQEATPSAPSQLGQVKRLVQLFEGRGSGSSAPAQPSPTRAASPVERPKSPPKALEAQPEASERGSAIVLEVTPARAKSTAALGSAAFLSPVRRSLRKRSGKGTPQAAAAPSVADLLAQANYAYVPNPALPDVPLSTAAPASQPDKQTPNACTPEKLGVEMFAADDEAEGALFAEEPRAEGSPAAAETKPSPPAALTSASKVVMEAMPAMRKATREMTGSAFFMSPVRRSSRLATSHAPDASELLEQTGFAYVPNPAVASLGSPSPARSRADARPPRSAQSSRYAPAAAAAASSARKTAGLDAPARAVEAKGTTAQARGELSSIIVDALLESDGSAEN